MPEFWWMRLDLVFLVGMSTSGGVFWESRSLKAEKDWGKVGKVVEKESCLETSRRGSQKERERERGRGGRGGGGGRGEEKGGGTKAREGRDRKSVV